MDSNPKPMKWWFHQHAEGTHFLFESFIIESSLSRFFAYLLIFAICWSERGLTYFLERQNQHSPADGGGNTSRLKRIGLRTVLYGTATTLRLWYMLITMYFIIDFFVVVVLALTSGQLVIEFLKSTRNSSAYHVAGGEEGDSIQHHHRHSSSTSGYTSFEYKEAQHNDIHGIGTTSPAGSSDSSKRRARHHDDIEEEQRLFAVPSDHEEFELTRSTH